MGSQVLLRIPGIQAALQAAWEGPYTVVDRVSRVTYRVSKGDGHPVKLAHINNLKVYQDRVLSMNAVTLVAQERGIGDDLLASKAVLSKDRCPGYNEAKLKSVLSELEMNFSVKPGLCKAIAFTFVKANHTLIYTLGFFCHCHVVNE